MKSYTDTESFRYLRQKLVDGIRDKGITDPRVLHAINSVPRQFFMPADLEEVAYEDRPFPIGQGQTISQPYTVAYQSQLLDVQETDRVLEIGTGSGYQAVILAVLASEVFSIERQRKLFERNIHFPYIRSFDNLYLFYGDGFAGLPEYAPFDRILITAAAPHLPEELLAQLKPGGKMVLPLGKEKPQRMIRITKTEEGELQKEYFENFSFVPMLRGTEG